MINRLNFLIKPGALDYYQQWLRQQLYPAGTRHLGYVLEKFLEPVDWIKLKEILFGNIWFLLAVIICGWAVVTRKKLLKGGRMGWGMWAGPILGLIIFTWQLTNIPPGIYVDEAVTGYNTYSLLMTGRDEYGKAMPILLRYFGSWLPGLNMYLLVPIVKVLGLSELAVRLPAAILGGGVILAIYVLLKLKTKSESVAGWGALFTAITPWMVFNARLGYEEMVGFTLFISGCGLLWRSLKVRNNFLWAITAWSLASYDAHVFRYLMFILLPAWVVINLKEVKLWPKKFWLKCISWLVLTQSLNIMVFNTPAFWVKQVIYRGVDITKIISNFWGQIVTYFSPVTLFVKIPDIDMQHQIPMTGLFYWWMIIPMVWGIMGWLKNWRQNKWWLALLTLSIVPAAASGVFISVQRALPLLLPLSMATAEGMGLIASDWGRIQKTVILSILLVYSGLLLFRSYFVLLPGLNAEAWNYGYQQLAEETKKQPGTKFVIDNTRNVRNYMLPLFYLHYSPEKLQRTADKNVLKNYYFSGNPPDNHKYGNLEFRPIVWQTDPCRDEIIAGDRLSISPSQATEHKLTKTGEVKSPTGEVLLLWYKTNPAEKCGKI